MRLCQQCGKEPLTRNNQLYCPSCVKLRKKDSNAYYKRLKQSKSSIGCKCGCGARTNSACTVQREAEISEKWPTPVFSGMGHFNLKVIERVFNHANT